MLPNIDIIEEVLYESAIGKGVHRGYCKTYKKASRSEKKVILDEFCAASGYHRKHAITLLKGLKGLLHINTF